MSHRCLLSFITRCIFHAGATLDLTSSQNISLIMPRLKNSADSPQSHPWWLLCLDFDGVTNLVSQDNILSERYQHFRDTHPLWPNQFSVYASWWLFDWL